MPVTSDSDPGQPASSNVAAVKATAGNLRTASDMVQACTISERRTVVRDRAFISTVRPMAESMTMNRVIHSAVRRDLDRLAAALAVAPDGDRARAGDLRRAYAHLHAQLKHHHEQEDELVFPALSRLGIDTLLLEEMDSEHVAMAEALDSTATLMEQYAGTGSTADAAAARTEVERTRAVVERHLAHEENELEPLIRPHLESAEWKQVEKGFRKAPPTTIGRFFAWLTDGMDPESQSYLRSTIPRPVILGFSNVFGRQYHRTIAPVWRPAPH